MLRDTTIQGSVHVENIIECEKIAIKMIILSKTNKVIQPHTHTVQNIDITDIDINYRNFRSTGRLIQIKRHFNILLICSLHVG